MRLIQYREADGSDRVGAADGDRVIDLTGEDGPATVHGIYYDCGGAAEGFEVALSRLLDRAPAPSLALSELLAGREGDGGPFPLKPASGPAGDPHALRIWLAGVTHEDSARLREIESKQATGDQVNVYEQKYRECAAGGRPELFAKGDPDSVVGHGQTLTRPGDTQRLVPETELVTLYGLDERGRLERLGYTGGNDATDNGIEAANPLNLPQAKNWAGGCASFGPVLVTASEFDDSDVAVSCEILRGGRRAAFKEGPTGQGNLNMPEGLFHMERSLFSRLPLHPRQLQVLYWGTPIVFAEEDFPGGLVAGDVVRMTFAGIGTLENEIADLPETGQLEGLGTR